MFWADVVLVVHFLFVLFIVGGFVCILIGWKLSWRWIGNWCFRMSHVLAMLFVTIETLVGIACPLTVLESKLRGSATTPGFIQFWVQRVLFYDLPAFIFTLVYVCLLFAIIAMLYIAPPRRRSCSNQT